VRRKQKKLFMAEERIAALEAEADQQRRTEAEEQARRADDQQGEAEKS
jgi:hypothetical protein